MTDIKPAAFEVSFRTGVIRAIVLKLQMEPNVNKVVGVVVIVLGLVSGWFFYDAGLRLESAGKSMTELRSKGGESVAEYYYQEVGKFGLAGSRFAFALGIASVMLSMGLGGSVLLNRPKS